MEEPYYYYYYYYKYYHCIILAWLYLKDRRVTGTQRNRRDDTQVRFQTLGCCVEVTASVHGTHILLSKLFIAAVLYRKKKINT